MMRDLSFLAFQNILRVLQKPSCNFIVIKMYRLSPHDHSKITTFGEDFQF